MKSISLQEFQALTGLPDAAVVWLLRHNRLLCTIDAERGIMVDVASAHNAAIVEALKARRRVVADAERDTLRSQIGTMIQDELDRILDEACARLQTK